jgi:hypothetical protein
MSALPSLAQVEQILGPYSIASIRAWLKYRGLPHTANTRASLIKLVHGLVQKEKIELKSVVEGLIGIEESSAKTVYLLETEVTPKHIAQIDHQLHGLGIHLSSGRAPATNVKSVPTLIYAINTANELRVKWAEKQVHVVIDKINEKFETQMVTKVVVFILDKETGVVQLRYDKPAEKHSHKVDGKVRKQAYYDFYREKIETITGLTFTVKELRPTLDKVLHANPPIVTPVTVDVIAEDGGTARLGHRTKGGDPRQTANWKSSHKPGSPMQTYESSPMNWIPEQTGGALTRVTFCSVNGADGTMTFRADCHEAELNYVLAKFV